MSTPTNPVTPPPSATGVINYDDANIILCGFNNKIEGSRRSTIINGAGNYITGRYNTHILGDYVSPTDQNSQSNGTSLPDLVDNAFYLGCANGLYSYGDVVAYAASDTNLKDNQTTIFHDDNTELQNAILKASNGIYPEKAISIYDTKNDYSDKDGLVLLNAISKISNSSNYDITDIQTGLASLVKLGLINDFKAISNELLIMEYFKKI